MKTKGLSIAIFLLLAFNLVAQEKTQRFGFEFSSGPSVATKKIDGTRMNPGFGFEGTLHYRFISQLGVYAGWGWNRMTADNSFAGKDVCLEETGYVIGLNYHQPLQNSKMAYYFRAGTLYNHIETENDEGDIIHDSHHGFGFQLATGIEIPLGKSWSLTPGLKFNSLSRSTSYEGISKQLDYQYLSIRLGVLKMF